MSEPPATTTGASLSTEKDAVNNNATLSNRSDGKKFEGDGVSFRGKLIGTKDLPVDRDEKICLDSMFILKSLARAHGDHKQKIQLNLTITAVKIIDDATKAQIASHELERISFVIIDPRDSRAFGYIYNTSDDRYQFWAIKTERAAVATAIVLKELFEFAFEQFKNAEATKEANQTIVTGTQPPPTSLPQVMSPVKIPRESECRV
ncbi:unnamed protein product [Rotaria sp. Silwood2]|nr:unnamed protein product [Rotaria sp. Silwood2]CAF4724997.1 unnamed protein product [Rotaria sp. Silwood2]